MKFRHDKLEFLGSPK